MFEQGLTTLRNIHNKFSSNVASVYPLHLFDDCNCRIDETL